MTVTYGALRADITTLHRETADSIFQIGLDTDAVLSLHPTIGLTKIHCGEGLLWVTQQDDPMDYVLKPGDTFKPEHSGLLVVQAMTESSVRITSAK